MQTSNITTRLHRKLGFENIKYKASHNTSCCSQNIVNIQPFNLFPNFYSADFYDIAVAFLINYWHLGFSFDPLYLIFNGPLRVCKDSHFMHLTFLDVWGLPLCCHDSMHKILFRYALGNSLMDTWRCTLFMYSHARAVCRRRPRWPRSTPRWSSSPSSPCSH